MCNAGVIYAYTKAAAESCRERLANAVERILSTADEALQPRVLWSMSYFQEGRASSDANIPPLIQGMSGQIMIFPPASSDLAFGDALLDSVRAVWRNIMGVEAHDDEFLRFSERVDVGDDDDESGT